MNKLKKEYLIETDVDYSDGIIIKPNQSIYKVIDDSIKNIIYIERKDDLMNSSEYLSLSIHDAKHLIMSLHEIINTAEYEPCVGDVVDVIDGKFKGMTGVINAYKTHDKLVVHIDETSENERFIAYIDKEHVV